VRYAFLWFALGALAGVSASHLYQQRQMQEARARIEHVTAQRDTLLSEARRLADENGLLRGQVAVSETTLVGVEQGAARDIAVAQGRAEEAERKLRELIDSPEEEASLDELLAAHRQEVDALTRRVAAMSDLILRQRALIGCVPEDEEDLSCPVARGLEGEVATWRATAEAEAAIARYWEAEYAATQTLWKNPAFVAPVSAGLAALLTFAVLK